jgi:hypothetical protein
LGEFGVIGWAEARVALKALMESGHEPGAILLLTEGKQHLLEAVQSIDEFVEDCCKGLRKRTEEQPPQLRIVTGTYSQANPSIDLSFQLVETEANIHQLIRIELLVTTGRVWREKEQ